jgi:hypothetical protein
MLTNAVVQRIMSAQATDQSKTLGITLNGKIITTGQYVPRAGKYCGLFYILCGKSDLTVILEAQTAPEISWPVSDPSIIYMVVGLDLDAPFPSFSVLGPALHWIQPGLTAGSDNKLTSNEPFVANYIGPAPPPKSAPHRYVFILFEQPNGFDTQKYAPAGGAPLSLWPRIRYDLDAWQKTAKLGEPLAVNYFLSN